MGVVIASMNSCRCKSLEWLKAMELCVIVKTVMGVR